MNRLIGTSLCAAALVVFWAAIAPAQDYSFAVPTLQMQVFVEPDASARIVYDITFRDSLGARPLDVVDIGTPHARYDLSNVRASIDGVALRDIRPSEYVHPGFEVHLAGQAIPPGQTGTLHVEFTMPDMVYQDTTRSDYASLRITPTWFGDQYVVGNTHIQVAVHLPRSIQPDEVLYQGLPFTQKAVSEKYTSVVWDWPADRLTGPHMVAVSFPKRDMKRVVAMTRLGLLLKWFSESPQARVVAGIVFLVLFGWLYFRFTGGTGVSLYVVLSAGAVVVFYVSPGLHLLAFPVVIGLIALNEWQLDRRPGYMPPIAQVEGGGIKRGLTAPEAAVLLEMPLARVLGLVIFGLLKKGALHQVQADPLAVEVLPALRFPQGSLPSEAARAAFYRQAGQEQKIVLHKYEHPFLALIEQSPGKTVREIDFALPLRDLIQTAAGRMKGFDLSDTRDYYRSIVRRAVEQARSVGDIPQKEQLLDRNFEWILMDDHYPTVFDYGRPYWPVWTRGWAGAGPVPASPPTAPAGTPGTTTFGDVAASFAGWAENTMGGMASALSPGPLQAPARAGGFVDLSVADRVTGEFFAALAEASSSGGGGGGGGCACACAGCACACACAGGGR